MQIELSYLKGRNENTPFIETLIWFLQEEIDAFYDKFGKINVEQEGNLYKADFPDDRVWIQDTPEIMGAFWFSQDSIQMGGISDPNLWIGNQILNHDKLRGVIVGILSDNQLKKWSQLSDRQILSQVLIYITKKCWKDTVDQILQVYDKEISLSLEVASSGSCFVTQIDISKVRMLIFESGVSKIKLSNFLWYCLKYKDGAHAEKLIKLINETNNEDIKKLAFIFWSLLVNEDTPYVNLEDWYHLLASMIIDHDFIYGSSDNIDIMLRIIQRDLPDVHNEIINKID